MLSPWGEVVGHFRVGAGGGEFIFPVGIFGTTSGMDMDGARSSTCCGCCPALWGWRAVIGGGGGAGLGGECPAATDDGREGWSDG
eukprot:1936762-Ditylum_brightwellii.AAC.1